MKFRKVLILLQTFCLFLLLSSFLNINLKAASQVAMGDIGFTESRDIYNGVNIEYTVGYNNNEDQKAYTVEIEKIEHIENEDEWEECTELGLI